MSERMLTLAEVCEIVARQKSWIYERVNRGEFPAPDEGRWFHSEIMEYLADRKARRVVGAVAGWKSEPEKKAA